MDGMGSEQAEACKDAGHGWVWTWMAVDKDMDAMEIAEMCGEMCGSVH